MGDRVEGVYEHESETFLQFLWNKKDGTVMGRTGGSWARIGIFYLIFYSFLAGWFSVMLGVFWTTLDPQTNPSYMPAERDGSKGGSLLQSPAMGYIPKPKHDNVESTLIWFKQNDAKDVKYWADYLNNTITNYYEHRGGNTDGQNLVNCDGKRKRDDNEACIFDPVLLGPDCQKKDQFGYSQGKPCVIIKMNKMINWRPETFKDTADLKKEKVLDKMPNELKQYMNDTSTNGVFDPKIWVSCEGENPADKEYIGKISYYPYPGFNAVFFPYRNQPGFMNPLVGVVFENPTPYVLINVRCTAWAKNIEVEPSKRLGLVHFELLVD